MLHFPLFMGFQGDPKDQPYKYMISVSRPEVAPPTLCGVCGGGEGGQDHNTERYNVSRPLPPALPPHRQNTDNHSLLGNVDSLCATHTEGRRTRKQETDAPLIKPFYRKIAKPHSVLHGICPKLHRFGKLAQAVAAIFQQ